MASLTVNITTLPTPVYSNVEGNVSYQYSFTGGNIVTLTVTVEQTTTSYPLTLLFIDLGYVQSDGATIISSEMVGANGAFALIEIEGPGNRLPNGLPAVLPPISAWTFIQQ